MPSPHILSAVADGVLSIEISRREKKNALSGEMYHTLADLLSGAAEDPAVRVALIHGQPDLFTAGNDLKDFLARKATDASPAIRFLRALSAFPKPAIAAVGGSAVGIGTTMLLHCDLVYAAQNARFQLPFVNLALCPEAGSSLLLPRAAGYQRAAELLFFGEPFDALAAKEAGIVNEVLAADHLLPRARERALRLAAQPPASIRATKALLQRPCADAMTEAMEEEFRLFSQLVAAPAAKEIFAAFLEKRPPDRSKIEGDQP